MKLLLSVHIAALIASAAISSTPVHEANGSWSSGGSFPITIVAPTNGNTLIFVGCANATTPTVSSLSTTGVTWRGTAAVASATNEACSVWCGDVGASAGTTVTINLSVATGTWRGNVSEWSGLPSCASALDATGSNNGTSSTTTTATITPTSGRNALFIACTRKGGTLNTGPNNTFTALGTPNSGWQFAYRVDASTSGTVSTNWTWSTSAAYDAEIATFLAASAGSSPVPHRVISGSLPESTVTIQAQ